MISKKYSQPLFMIFMSFGMSVIMSGVVTAVNTGFSDGFLIDFNCLVILLFQLHYCSIYYGTNYETFS